MSCEDFPACGHDDGLGCDWVSPNEIQPCPVCIEARATYPYHNGWEGSCPTLRAKALVSSHCANFSDSVDSCDGEVADTMHHGVALCADCYAEAVEYDRQLAEQYDSTAPFYQSSEPYPGAWRDSELHAYNNGLDNY